MRLSVIIALTVALSAAPAFGQSLRSLCETSAETAEDAAQMRRDGTHTEAEALAEIAARHADAPELQALAAEIAAWVWSLPEDDLDPRAIGVAFFDRCIGQ